MVTNTVGFPWEKKDVLVERDELVKRVWLMRDLIGSDRFNGLSSVDQYLLRCQLESMIGYLDLLDYRIELFDRVSK